MAAQKDSLGWVLQSSICSLHQHPPSNLQKDSRQFPNHMAALSSSSLEMLAPFLSTVVGWKQQPLDRSPERDVKTA